MSTPIEVAAHAEALIDFIKRGLLEERIIICTVDDHTGETLTALLQSTKDTAYAFLGNTSNPPAADSVPLG